MSSQSSKCGAVLSTKKKRRKSYYKTEKQRSVEALDPRRNLPLNRYNLYCILERQRLVQSNPDYRPSENEVALPSDIYTGYEGMQLPKLPPRYQHLVIANDWCERRHIEYVYPKTQNSILTIELPLFRFVPSKRKLVKRSHRKAHGMFSLKEISRLTADTWKTVDGETLEYLTVAARLISERYKQIETDLGGPLAKKQSRRQTKRRSSPSSSQRYLPPYQLASMTLCAASRTIAKETRTISCASNPQPARR